MRLRANNKFKRLLSIRNYTQLKLMVLKTIRVFIEMIYF